jgi:hypothetical protein
MNTSGSYHNPELENILYKRHNQYKKECEKNAVLLGARNTPKLTGDDFRPFIGGVVAFYRGLFAYAHQFLQPDSQGPNAKITMEWASERDKIFDEEIKKRKHANALDEHKLEDYHPTMMTLRILFSAIVVLIYGLGEVMFNTKGFQLIGENKLFAFIIALGVSTLVCVLSHVAPHFHKRAKTKRRRRLIEIGTILLVTCLFIALAILRTKVLAMQGENASPFVFIIINLFFFIVSTLFSYIIDPTLDEIREHLHFLERHLRIIRRKKEIKEIEADKIKLRDQAKAVTTLSMAITVHSKDIDELIKSMFHETVEHFKTTNIIHRTDGGVPDCFSTNIDLFDDF